MHFTGAIHDARPLTFEPCVARVFRQRALQSSLRWWKSALTGKATCYVWLRGFIDWVCVDGVGGGHCPSGGWAGGFLGGGVGVGGCQAGRRYGSVHNAAERQLERH